MSTSGITVPTLVAAFVFGIVVNAASAALFLHVSSHGSTAVRDGQRLVLTTFLLSAALWAQSDFVSIAINPTATSSCQIGIIFSTLFDQIARFSVEQYLVWAINKGAKSGVQQMFLQSLVLGRFVVGCIFVGFSRPQFDPVCVPMSSMLPIAIVTIAMDVVLIFAMAIMAIMSGLMSDAREGGPDAGRSKSILLVMVAFAIWTATSIVMLLGMTNSDLLLRTLMPAIGLLILVFVVTACNDALTTGLTRTRTRQPDSPGIRNITTGRSISTDASSDYPPSRFEDIKQSEIMTAFEQPREAPQPQIPQMPSSLSRPVVMMATVESSQPTAFAPAVSAFTTAASVSATRKADLGPQGPRGKRSLLDLRGGPAAGRGGKIMISNPILEENGDQNPLNKIATISLEEAAQSERERRANDLQRESALIAKRPAPQPPNMSTEEAMKRSVSLRRKEVASVSSQPPMPTASSLEPMPVATTSSAQLSPGVEELRRRSPRQPPVDSQMNRPTRPKSSAISSMPMPAAPSPTIPLPPPQQNLPEQFAQDLIDEQSLREEMAQMDQPEQMNFTVEPSMAANDFIIQPAGFAPPRPTRTDSDLPAPPMGVDTSVRRPEIRPSRQLPKTPTEPAPAVSVSALQRRPTIGLPGNPRAMAMKALGNEASAGRQQTVMFMNNIVYDNPETVQDIINDANTKEQTRRSTQSIVHRPRPIPRHLEKDRAIFPAEPSPNLAGHRRSKSGGSIMGRKSILLSNPGSPTQLPPLPLPPKNIGYKMERPSADRPQPNNTKSMTFDEKMTLLFPTPPSGETMNRRRSSVPEIPSLPLDYMPVIVSPSEGYDHDNRMSQSTTRTGRTSIKTENILEVDELPRRGTDHSEGRELSMVDDVGSAWLPGLAGNSMVMSDASMRPSMGANSTTNGGRKRASSPVLPPVRDSTTTVSSSGRTHDDATTNWGSVHSPVVAVPIPASRQMARTTYINAERSGEQRGERGEGRNNVNKMAPTAVLVDDAAPLLPLLPATTYNAGVARALSPPMSDEDDGKIQMKNEKTSEKRESQWYRRVGDNNTLSFSDRKERTRSRKMPPPTPLLLNPPSTKNPVIVKAAEPSPLESPEQALAYIQEQLRRYEEPNLAVTAEETPTRRLALLDNLEKEMDMQAGHWQEMQHNLRHDSLSTIQTLSPAAESRRQSVLSTHNIVAAVPQLQQHQHQQHQQKDAVTINIGADRRAARRSRIQSGTLSSIAASTTGPLRNSTYNKKKPFANAVIDLGALGSPTPPDSDEDDLDLRLHRPFDADDAELVDSVAKKLSQPTAHKQKPSLWTPNTKPATMTTTTLLWTPAPAVSSRESAIFIALSQLPVQAPGKKSKVAKKTLSGPLPIESVNLWTKNISQPAHGAVAHSGRGLWTAHVQVNSMQVQQSPVAAQVPSEEELQMQKMLDLELEMAAMEASREERRASSAQKAPRPLTQRPPRRNKRVTMLPDILESPKPLPDKRGTLGIFQFPWGERSDTAKPPSLPSRGAPFGAMPGTMASGGGQLNAALEARSRELEADEYSSSFFDDYDDDEDYDNDDEDQGFDDDASGSDDGFDENTLWEIASLLKTEQVPSTLSMFPPPLASGSVMGDYMAEMPLDNETLDNGNSIVVDDILVDLEDGNRTESQRDSQLWNERQDMWVATDKTVKTLSMAQPDETTWKSYDTVNQGATLRSKPRTSEPDQVETSQLWDRSTGAKVIKTLPANPRSNLWAAAQQKKLKQQQQQQVGDNKMWTPRAKNIVTSKFNKTHLFDKDVAAAAKMASAVVRTTDLEPAARNMPRVRRTLSRAPLEKLVSSSLWAAAPQKKDNKMWAPRTKKAVVVKTSKKMLFDKEAAAAAMIESAVTRTTDMEPAALNMPRTPRTPSRAPLERLMSSSLWSAASGHKSQLWAPMPVPKVRAKGHLFDRDVAAVENMRKPTRTTAKEPAALTMMRAPRSLSHLPVLRLESNSLWSATATSTHHVQVNTQYNWILAKDPKSLPVIVDDTIPASNVGVKQNTWWEKMKAAAGMSTSSPVAPLDTKKLAEAQIDSVRMALKTTPLLPPTQQQQKRIERPAVSSSEWNDALQEAMAASYPWLQRRISATPSQWQAELERAMTRSYPFDAARQHPVLAAGSSTLVPADNDVSKVHPVFFQPVEEEIKAESPAEIVIQLAQSSPTVAVQQQSEEDAAYHAHIMAMENQAIARLQALESVGHGVVLRY
ncbi:hypothetical protein SBRCBS47491_006140 [Sporothrix bragantina]|uniref:Uncharacterized protein n=1 Tax=Sporothrix bragantina TaxID=671064 RepID=A0ABP0C3B9_9PEZI